MLIFLLSGEGGFFWQRYSVKTVFRNIAGLKAGAPVRVAGVEVGSVSDVDFIGDQVEVTMEIEEEHQPRITTESRAVLGSVSLLGEGAVDITAVEPRARRFPNGATFRPVRRRRRSPKSARRRTAGHRGGDAACCKDIRQGRGTVGKLFTDEARLPRSQRAGAVG